MNNSLIPYSFIPGTKAKANEINANFLALANKIADNQDLAAQNYETLNTAIDNYVETMTNTIADYTDTLNTDKADTDLSNVAANIDYITDTWTSGESWYRRYASGWVEQGGKTVTDTSEIVFPVEMADTNYNFHLCFMGNTSGSLTPRNAADEYKTTTGITGLCMHGEAGGAQANYNCLCANWHWFVKGMGAAV